MRRIELDRVLGLGGVAVVLLVVAALALMFVAPAWAQPYIEQPSGYSPGVPSTVSLTASTSGAITGLTQLAKYRISCNVDATYRTGSGTPTAVTTDNDLPAKTIERFTLRVGETAVAFISASAGTCKAARVSN